MRQFTYSDNRVTSETWYNTVADANAQQNATEVMHYSYDQNGNLTAEWDANSAISYTYDNVTHQGLEVDLAGNGGKSPVFT